MTQVSVTVTRCEDASDEFQYLLSEGSGPIRIGRSPANHVKVDFRGISAYHLEIRAGFDGPESGLVRACDLSMNGTSLELPGGEKKSLQKGVETSIPDGTKLTVPGKIKKAEGQSEIRRSYVVRWHRVQSNGDVGQDHEETPAFPVKATETPLPNGSTPPPSDVPVPVPEAETQLPVASNGVAEASSPTHSDSQDVQPPVHADANVSLPAGAQLRPKAQPKRPAALAQAQKAAAEDSSSSDKEQKTSKRVAQKSRSRDGSGGQSKSRGRGRGRQRKRSGSGSGSNSHSRKRRRRRKRSKSRGGKRKRKRSKSSSSSSSESKSDDNDDKASSTAAAGNPMAMQQPWGMHWGAQSAWAWNPYMQGNAQPQMTVDMIKQQIYFMYQRFKPEKLPEYENILKKYKGSEYELLQAMRSKYMGSGNAAGPAGGAAK